MPRDSRAEILKICYKISISGNKSQINLITVVLYIYNNINKQSQLSKTLLKMSHKLKVCDLGYHIHL